MPYIVTTMPAGSAAHPERMARRAVATLEEARERAEDTVFDHLGPERMPDDRPVEFATYARNLPEEGGTIGPLPDGTVIEVERVRWETFPEYAKPGDATEAQRQNRGLEAFNAAQ